MMVWCMPCFCFMRWYIQELCLGICVDRMLLMSGMRAWKTWKFSWQWIFHYASTCNTESCGFVSLVSSIFRALYLSIMGISRKNDRVHKAEIINFRDFDTWLREDSDFKWLRSFYFDRGKKKRGQRAPGVEKGGKGLRHFSLKGVKLLYILILSQQFCDVIGLGFGWLQMLVFKFLWCKTVKHCSVSEYYRQSIWVYWSYYPVYGFNKHIQEDFAVCL